MITIVLFFFFYKKKQTILFTKYKSTIVKPLRLITKVNGVYNVPTSDSIFLKALEDDLIFELITQKTDSITSSQVIQPLSVNSDTTFVFELQGYDITPVVTNYPTVRYTNLKGGNYIFKYSISTLTKSLPQSETFFIHIDESLSETWWFYPAIVGFAITIISVVVYLWTVYEFRQKLKMSNIRNRIAKDLHDEIGTDLSILILSLKDTQRTFEHDATLQNMLEEIKDDTLETANNLSDAVWMLKPQNDSFEKLFEKIEAFTKRTFKKAQIELVFENHIKDKKDWKISMERRRNVYLIFREAINNIIKHAEATHVFISVKREINGASVVITDDGIGFIEADVLEEGGNGLLNFRQRAMESFIQFDLKSTPSVGTTIQLFIPEI